MPETNRSQTHLKSSKEQGKVEKEIHDLNCKALARVSFAAMGLDNSHDINADYTSEEENNHDKLYTGKSVCSDRPKGKSNKKHTT
jgi:hypothetical protein